MTDVKAHLREMLADKENAQVDEAVQWTLNDDTARQELLSGVVAKDDAYRFNCFNALYQISEEQPRVLYPEWDYFVGLLDSKNAFHRAAAVRLLANLTSADEEGRFEELFDRYFDLLDDDKVMVARYLAQQAGKIAMAKPYLQPQITQILLAVDGTNHNQSRKDLLNGDIIQAFDEFWAEADDKESILAFVQAQLECSSPKTRKAAKAFLDKHDQ